jgi:segregation and condensation protein A
MTDAPAENSVEMPELVDDAAGPGIQTLPRIELDQFEGPFDVLLYLIRTQELDIFDIPIVKITEQYLAFLDQLTGQHLELAGEFIVMAATLIQIKSRMLIPVEVEAEEDEEIIEEDPRLELVEKLLEYRRFRDLSWALGRRFEMADDCFGRRVKPVIEADPDEEDVIDISLYDLMNALRNTLKYLLDKPIHEVIGEGSSIEEKIARIEELLDASDSVAWSQLAKESRTRVEIVCCLLAILELCRMYRVRVHQHESFGEIRLFARKPGDAPPPELEPAGVVEEQE